jgi:hypothetical protein
MSSLYVAKSQNLSVAWTEVFLHLMERGVDEICPAVIAITDFDERSLPCEIPSIQAAINSVNKQSCRTVASTIFPNSLWNQADPDNAKLLYSRYEKVWKTIAKCPANAKGVYFRRLTAYKALPDDPAQAPVNQLDHIIQTYHRGNHRHSALQASIFDPSRDHSHNRQRGFPCLQQVAFNAADGHLEVTGFYALQHHVPKAYGNYLGLCWLGRFMAQQLDLKLRQVTCIASSLKLPTGDGYSKSSLEPLKQTLTKTLQTQMARAA